VCGGENEVARRDIVTVSCPTRKWIKSASNAPDTFTNPTCWQKRLRSARVRDVDVLSIRHHDCSPPLLRLSISWKLPRSEACSVLAATNKSNTFAIHLPKCMSSNLDSTSVAGGLMLRPVWGIAELVRTLLEDHGCAGSQPQSSLRSLLPMLADCWRPTSSPQSFVLGNENQR
jgi:hypothetical protein